MSLIVLTKPVCCSEVGAVVGEGVGAEGEGSGGRVSGCPGSATDGPDVLAGPAVVAVGVIADIDVDPAALLDPGLTGIPADGGAVTCAEQATSTRAARTAVAVRTVRS